MSGIPTTLLLPLRQALMKCDEFGNQQLLRFLFMDKRLQPWVANLPEAASSGQRVDFTIVYLADNYLTNGENALTILLRVLAERYDPNDARHDNLTTL